MGSAPSKDPYVIKPTIMSMTKNDEDSSNNSSKVPSIARSIGSRTTVMDKDLAKSVLILSF